MPNIEIGKVITFRNIRDPHPRCGEVIKIEKDAVVVQTGPNFDPSLQTEVCVALNRICDTN